MYIFDLISNSAQRHFKASSASFTALQLAVQAFSDYSFAETLLNHAYRIEETLASFELNFIPENIVGIDESAYEGVNDWESDYFWNYANSINPETKDSLEVIMKSCPWADEHFVKSVIRPILNIAHLENMLINWKGMDEDTHIQANSDSIIALCGDLKVILDYAGIYTQLSDSNKIQTAITMQKNILSSMDYLVSYQLKNIVDAKVYSLVSALQNLLTVIAIDYSAATKDVQSFDLILCREPKYKTAYNNLNENQELGSVQLPRSLFTPLPFAQSNEGHSINGIVKLHTSQAIAPNDLEYAISYTLDQSCDCNHDCCGCISVNFNAQHIGDGYLWIRRTTSQNY